MKMWHWFLISFVLILGIAYAGLSYMMGGPRDVYGFLRYALPQWRRGALRVGDTAPDFQLYTTNGNETFRMSERRGNRPMVLIFGSYT